MCWKALKHSWTDVEYVATLCLRHSVIPSCHQANPLTDLGVNYDVMSSCFWILEGQLGILGVATWLVMKSNGPIILHRSSHTCEMGRHLSSGGTQPSQHNAWARQSFQPTFVGKLISEAKHQRN